ncbi:MAG: hypothetical protein QM817_39885 [Archangium sp.]
MRARFLVPAFVLILLAVAAVIWSLVRRSGHRVRPGKVEVVLVDAFGQPWSDESEVWLGNESRTTVGGVAGVFDVAPGTLPFVARGFSGWRGHLHMTSAPVEGGQFELTVSGFPASEVQRLEVRLGPSLAHVSQTVAGDLYDLWKAGRDVSVQVLQSDGGPAANALVLCRHQKNVTADESGVASCGSLTGDVEISASANGFGNSLWLDADAGEATLVLDRPGFALDVEVRGVRDAGHITLNSKETSDMVFSRTNFFTVPFVPLARTIVCSSDDLPKACDVLVPDGGTHYSLVLEAGPPGTLEFRPTLGGKPLLQPILYLDRVQHAPQSSAVQSMALSRGRHVLVINTRSGPERYETLFEIEPGKTTSLGDLPLAPP